MGYKVKNTGGITLIALIITIIVLLILAGVSIAILTGQNGILTQTQNAKQITEISQIKEEWDVEKLGLKMQEQKLEEINVSGEDIKNYIKSMPDNLIGKISIIKGELAYDINKFTKEEQLTLKSDYGFKATGDNTAPYGSAEKKLKDGKVEITVFSADDESDVDKIILPDGTSKKIQYETENILLRGIYLKAEEMTKEKLGKYFKNVTGDEKNKLTSVKETAKYDVILDLNAYGAPADANFLNECFMNGKNLVTSGNDSTSGLEIINQSYWIEGKLNVEIDKQNEVTKYYNAIPGQDSLYYIKFRQDTDIWCTGTAAGKDTDVVGIYENENGNKWLHKHYGEFKNVELFYRNAIYRVTGSRSATYKVDKNGTYTFTIVDLAGNETKIDVEVTEL